MIKEMALKSLVNSKRVFSTDLNSVWHRWRLVYSNCLQLQITSFIWIPSHIGITGNSLADSEAKAALQLPVTNLPVPYSDFKGLIKSYVDKRWQQSWDTEANNKLHGIQPLIHTQPICSLPRRDERLIHRLRIGHTHLTHSFRLKKEQPPQCTHCQVPLTVQHILIDCTYFDTNCVHFLTRAFTK